MDYKITRENTVTQIFENLKKEQNSITGLLLSLLTDSRVIELSSGEVTRPETITRSLNNPVENGLLCEKIFGPLKDRTCRCKRYVQIQQEGVVCPQCGVETISSKNRYDRFGHINLNTMVINPLFHSVIRLLTRLTVEDYMNVVYNGQNLYFKPNEKSGYLYINSMLGDVVANHEPDTIDLGIGVPAIKNLLQSINLCKVRDQIISKKKTANITNFSEHQRRYLLYLIEDMINTNFHLSDVIMTKILVLPAGFRNEYFDGNTIRRNNLNSLYSIVIRRNHRVNKIRQIKNLTPVLINREYGVLQEGIDMLYFGTKIHKLECKGLVTLYSGKEGRIRKNMLGKRTDYSGRSVIVPGLGLKLGEIGLPYKMLVELFKPFIVRHLRQHHAMGIKEAERIWRNKGKIVYEIVDEIIESKTKSVLGNRQPTLHRQGIMAYNIKAAQGEAIEIHPCVTGPYNADFDGDQMAIHLPFGNKAQEEVKNLMIPQNNLLLPLNSEPNIVPTQEQIYGLYYLTKNEDTKNEDTKEKGIFPNFHDAYLAYKLSHGKITIHSYVKVKHEGKVVSNTIGRLLFHEKTGIWIEEPLTKSVIKSLMSKLYNTWEHEKYLELVDTLKDIGFEYATLSGVSFCYDDTFDEFCDTKRTELVGKKEREAQVIVDEMKAHIETRIDNPAVEMAVCGARGNITQLSQLIASKGLQAKADGTIIPYPVVNSLGTGLTENEFFLTVYGARKSLSDKKMAVGDAGFIAHKLIKGCRDLIIDQEDCGSSLGIIIPKDVSYGRTILEDYGDTVLVRSPVTCFSENICSKCYGLELGRRIPSRIGDAVGIIASESLTEPATQMVMRCEDGLVHVGNNLIPFCDLFDNLVKEDVSSKELNNVIVEGKNGIVDALKIQKHFPEDKMLFITTKSGHSLICQANHPLFIKEKSIHEKYENKKVQLVGDQLYKDHITGKTWKATSDSLIEIVADNIQRGDAIWIDRKIALIEGTITPNVNPYLAGLYMSDGCMRVGNGTECYENVELAVTIEKPDKDIREKLVSTSKELEPYEYDTCVQYYGVNKCKRIREVILGKYSYEKRLHSDFNLYSTSWLKDFLDGMIDGDGTVFVKDDVTIAKIHTSSYYLLQQLQVIAVKLGLNINSQLHSDIDRHNRPQFVISLRFPANYFSQSIRVARKGGIKSRKQKHYNAVCGFDMIMTKTEMPNWNYPVYDIQTTTKEFMLGMVQCHNTFHTGGAVEKIQGDAKVAKHEGIVKYVDIEEGKTIINSTINFYSDDSMEYTPRIQIYNEKGLLQQEEYLPTGSILEISDNQTVDIGDTLYDEGVSNFDIASSLPDLQALYDNKTKNSALIANKNGIITKIEPSNDNLYLNIYIDDTCIKVPKGSRLLFDIGAKVKKGDKLTTGNYDYNKLIEIGGLKLSAEKFVEQGLKIYNDNNIKAYSIHLEVVFRALTSCKVLIEGNEPGKIVKRHDERLGIPIVVGITKLITFEGSMLKRMSIGWVKNGFVNALTRSPKIGDCETDKIVIGAFPAVGEGTNPDYISCFKENTWTHLKG